ncbi:hypothetical protein C1H46_012390 [Malus baccata]|uniref:Uncharacterized protein n=1 Tax=Malus baccata TaxID=106549 RepID=A0A540MTI6_MALBA|nr:hypothetical protein C1H46_012390 [Malus baccata]
MQFSIGKPILEHCSLNFTEISMTPFDHCVSLVEQQCIRRRGLEPRRPCTVSEDKYVSLRENSCDAFHRLCSFLFALVVVEV